MRALSLKTLNGLRDRLRRRMGEARKSLNVKKRRKLLLESLEGRSLLAGITVSTIDDNVDGNTSSIANLISTPGGSGISLREAILATNNDAGADTITFSPALNGQAIVLGGSGRLVVTDDLAIQGPGPDQLAVSGNNATGIFNITDSTATVKNVSLSGLTLRNALDNSLYGAAVRVAETLNVSNVHFQDNSGIAGAAIHVDGSTVTVVDSRFDNNDATTFHGGAITNFGNLDVTHSVFDGNSAATDGGAIYGGIDTRVRDSVLTNNVAARDGGAIYHEVGTLVLRNSEVTNNSTGASAGIDDGNGGAVFNSGNAYVGNSTFSGNSATRVGGALYHKGGGSLTAVNNTIINNVADSNDDGFGNGGGVSEEFGATNNPLLYNNIIAGNIVNFFGGSPNDLGTANTLSSNNLIGDASSAGGLVHGTNGNIVGNAGSGVIDINTVLNTTLSDNGGATATYALVSGSPALNAGSNSLAVDENLNPLPTDQRGYPFSRTMDGTVDMGALESHTGPFVVSTIADEQDLDYSFGDLSLREAIDIANELPGIDDIVFDSTLAGQTITLNGSFLFVNEGVSISGAAAPGLTISGNDQSRIFSLDNFDVLTQAFISISNLRLIDGNETVSFGGGAIRNSENLSLTNVTIESSRATTGGALENDHNGTVTISSSTFNGNESTGDGGAITNTGVMVIDSSSFSFNTAASEGGAVYNFDFSANMTITNSLIGENSAFVGAGVFNSANATLDVASTQLYFNAASGDAGGLYNDGNAVIVNSLVYDNSTGLSGGGLFNDSNGFMEVYDSLLTRNTAEVIGGGIDNDGRLWFVNSTLSFNSAKQQGGGLSTFARPVFITNSTIIGNRSDSDGTGSQFGGGIFRGSATVTLNNTIVAGNLNGTGTAANDISGLMGSSSANNLIGSASWAGGLVNGTNGNIVGNSGTGVRPIGTILESTLAFNGSSYYYPLVAGSVAIDAGDNAKAVDRFSSALVNDQRGFPYARVLDGPDSGIVPTVDIGAVEAFANFIVDTSADELDGDFSAGDLSLREALQLAGLYPEDNQISFAPGLSGSTITLGLGELDVNSNVVINGLGVSNLTVSGGNSSRVFYIQPGVTATINDLKIQDGFHVSGLENGGAGLYNNGTLTMNRVAMVSNEASINGFGGALANFGTATINASTLSDNTAAFDGAIANVGTLTLSDTDVLNNTSTAAGAVGGVHNNPGATMTVNTNSVFSGNSGEFGAIQNSGTLNVTNTTFLQNNGSLKGGAIFTVPSGTTTIANSSFTANTSGPAGGGAIHNEGTTSVTSSSFSTNSSTGAGGALVNLGTMNLTGVDVIANTSDDFGGGIYSGAGNTLNITSSSIRNNQSDIDAGGVYSDGVSNITRSSIHGNTTTGSGGGLFNDSNGNMSVRDSSIYNNTADIIGGGIDNDGRLWVVNSTVSGNSSKQQGGGISTFNLPVVITNSTITGNRSDSDGTGSQFGGGIFRGGATVTLNNTIVAGNLNGTGTNANDISGAMGTASANNLIGSATWAGGLVDGTNENIVGNAGTGVRPIASILNTTLANNGGPTLTHALVRDSVAIDRGNNAKAVDKALASLLLDQRGQTRFINGDGIGDATVDIGAFEGVGPTIANFGADRTYTENAVPIVVTLSATISDVDNSGYANGRLTVTNEFAAVDDRLTILAQGTGAGQIGVSGSNVTYGGVNFATFTGGSGSTPLVVNFLPNATSAFAQALVRRIAFSAVGDNPTPGNTTIRFNLTDASGAMGASASKTVTVVVSNDRPVVNNFGGDITYTEDDPTLRVATSTASVTDPDSSNFDTGTMTFTFTAGGRPEDRFIIRTSATLTTSPSNEVLFNGTVFGSFTGGVGTTPLAFTFNANATPAIVSTLLRSVYYQNLSQAPSTNVRTIRVLVTDGDGGTSLAVTKNLNVVSVNDNPVLGGISGTTSPYTMNNASGLVLAPSATVSDVDNPGFNNGKLTIEVTSGANTSNRIYFLTSLFTFSGNNIIRNGVTIGTITSDGVGLNKLEVTFNANASPSTIQLLLRTIRFRTIGSTTNVDRTLSFSLTDGSGGTSATLTRTVDVV